MADNPYSQRDQYRVLPPGRVGLAPMIGLAALMFSVPPLLRQVEELTPLTPGPLVQAGLAPGFGDSGDLSLVVHIQASGFFIEGADAVLAPNDRRIWCEADRCTEADMRTLTQRLAAVKAVHPGSDHVVFVAGMTVPFGRVQAAMDAARSDSWDRLPGDEPTWLFPRVTVQSDQLGQDRYLRLAGPPTVRLWL